MNADAPRPELAPEVPPAACARCGACPECGAPAEDPTGTPVAMLGEFAEIAMAMARALGRQVAAMGMAGQAEVEMLSEVGRSLRRSLALQQKLREESRRSAEQRHAESLRRIDAQVRAQFRVRKAAIVRALEGEIDAHVAEHGGDAERLLCDMHERLFDADVARASTKADVDAICLSICVGLGITPRDETWSAALMACEAHGMLLELRAADASREAREAAASDQPIEAPPKEKRVYPKIGPFTFDENGAIVSKDPPEFDPPETQWHPDILNRPPVDLLKDRKPPETG